MVATLASGATTGEDPMTNSHVCKHMCRHYVAVRDDSFDDVVLLRGTFALMNAADEFVRWMMRDVSCVRIIGTSHRAGGEHYDEFLRLERREDGWYRRNIIGWTKFEEPVPVAGWATSKEPPVVKKTSTIVLEDIKDPDGWGALITALGYSGYENEHRRRKFFRWGEYAAVELVIDEDMNIVGGRVLPRSG